MATYRVRTTDGFERTQRAQLVRTDANTLYFEDRIAGTWRTVHEIPLDRVKSLQRRFTENDGRWAWLTEALPSPAEDRAWQRSAPGR
ncbi:hypothetical protein [Nocardiopsis chromatogenes]|uniref:hypothetical protein n=1 Tax=Nocardiopsis chromatogenes TaxID=280239 RepID=UPI00034716B8|nr:hypothetical protein [Nocardiopsis chromatogenes]